MFSDVFEIKRTWHDAAGAPRAATDANGAPGLPEVADAPPIAAALPDQAARGWLAHLKARLAAPARQQETA